MDNIADRDRVEQSDVVDASPSRHDFTRLDIGSVQLVLDMSTSCPRLLVALHTCVQ